MKNLDSFAKQRDVVLVGNDQFVGKRKLKDCWGDEVYTVCNLVDVDVPM